jgi:hypothetical protein
MKRLKDLNDLIAVEQDFERFSMLIAELNQLSDEQQEGEPPVKKLADDTSTPILVPREPRRSTPLRGPFAASVRSARA